MERVAVEVERSIRRLLTLMPFSLVSGIERALDLEGRPWSSSRRSLDDGDAIRQRPAAPVLRDGAEQAMFDPVPLCAAETCEERSNARNHMEAD